MLIVNYICKKVSWKTFDSIHLNLEFVLVGLINAPKWS